MFIPYLGKWWEMIQFWRSYFSNGLVQSPTRHVLSAIRDDEPDKLKTGIPVLLGWKNPYYCNLGCFFWEPQGCPINVPKDVDLSWVVDVLYKKPLICRGWLWPVSALERKLEWVNRTFHVILRRHRNENVLQTYTLFLLPSSSFEPIIYYSNSEWYKGRGKKEKAIVPAESAKHISCKSCFQWDKIENAAILKFSGSFPPKFRHCSISSICNDLPGSFVETKRYMTSSPESPLAP